MDEKTGATLGAAQREAIRNGELESKPPRCSYTDPPEEHPPGEPPEAGWCFNRAVWWLELEHTERGDTWRIARCGEHASGEDLPHPVVGKEPIEGGE